VVDVLLCNCQDPFVLALFRATLGRLKNFKEAAEWGPLETPKKTLLRHQVYLCKTLPCKAKIDFTNEMITFSRAFRHGFVLQGSADQLTQLVGLQLNLGVSDRIKRLILSRISVALIQSSTAHDLKTCR